MLWRDPQRRAGGLTVWFAFSLTAVLLAGCGGAGPTIPSSSVTAPAASMPPATPTVPSSQPSGSKSPSTEPSAQASSKPTDAPASAAVPSTPPATTAAAWRTTKDMIRPHAFHAATLLPDGRVLVAGGLVNDRLDGKVSASAELFDPGSGKWIATRAMVVPRWGQTATLLPDGKVLVAGSYVNSSDRLASAELYDPGTGRWTPTGSMNIGRGGHTATLLPNGRVLVVGGGAMDTLLEGGPRSATAELYDPATGEWTATGSMVEARTDFTATLLHDGRVLVAGGDGSFTAAELYDPVTGRWTATGSMADGRFGHTATLLPDGTVLVTGGCACSDPGAWASAELYNPGTGRWTATGSMGMARIHHTATLLADGTVIAVNDGLYDRPTSAELYDPRSGHWTDTASPAVPRVGYTASLLLDGRVLVAGDYSHNSRKAELYEPGVGR
jgi:hypothetical protein